MVGVVLSATVTGAIHVEVRPGNVVAVVVILRIRGTGGADVDMTREEIVKTWPTSTLLLAIGMHADVLLHPYSSQVLCLQWPDGKGGVTVRFKKNDNRRIPGDATQSPDDGQASRIEKERG